MLTQRLRAAFTGTATSAVTGTVGDRGRRVLIGLMFPLSDFDAISRVAVILSLIVEHICQEFDVL